MLDTDLVFGPILVTFLVGITTVLLYWFSTRNFDFWKKKNVPYVKPFPFVGTVFESLTKPFHEAELRRYRELGRVYGHFEANRPVLSVAEPSLVRDILVKDFHIFADRRRLDTGNQIVDRNLFMIQGEDWKRIRTTVSVTFSTGKIRRVMGIFKDCAETLVQNFKTAAEKGTPIEVKSVYGAFAMDVIASAAFSTKIDSFNDPQNEFVSAAKRAFRHKFSWRYALWYLAPWLMRMFNIYLFEPKITGFFREATLQIIEERKRTGQTRNDFLQLLLDAVKEISEDPKPEKESEDITSNYGEDDTKHQMFKTVTKKNLSNDEFVAQCVIFFLAGYDTVASTLSFSSYLLALNQDVQEKAFAEIVKVIEASHGEMTYEAIQSMKYLDNIVSEALRLYPSVVRLERVANSDYELGDTGITIPKGTLITIPSHAMHNDPKLFLHPERFNPDRFKPEERAKRDQCTYLPFGSGPRNCVGMRFALVEVKVCLAYVIANFKISRCPQTKVPLEFMNGQRLLQAKDITLLLEPRTNCPLKK